MGNNIKFNFIDEYAGFRPEDSAMTRFLTRHFDAELSDSPDYVIVGPYGHGHLTCNAIKIFWTGENVTPDFNVVDYAIGFDHLSFGDRYLRVPLYAFRGAFVNFRDAASQPSDAQLLQRDFCSFVVSNNGGDPIRTKFYNELSKYKRIDSGGRYMNNIGGPIADKQAFVAAHKFNIAFENSAYPGYVTEKLMEAQAAWSVPVYWGDPMVTTDFREGGMIRLRSDDDIEWAINEIIRLDKDDAAYLAMCKDICLTQGKEHYEKLLFDFFASIFSQPLDQARRLAEYGRQSDVYIPELVRAFDCKRKLESPKRIAHTLYSKIFRH